MTEDSPHNPAKVSIDSLLRGVLRKLGDILDGFTGRRKEPPSALATSELIERLKKLLDQRAIDVRGKGKIVPHHIVLKTQWDKFSTDDPENLTALEDELLVAIVDHINDKRYFTNAPVMIEVKPDYFSEGVHFIASFDQDIDDESEATVVRFPVDEPRSGKDSEPEPEGEDQPPSAAEDRTTNFLFTANFETEAGEKVTKLRVRENGRISVGRTAESLLDIDDTSVSKHHAVIVVGEDGAITIADTGSTNGTMVNGERLAYGEARTIDPEDEVTFGSVLMRFSVEKEHREDIPEPEEVEGDPEGEG